jgi:hypothetical protein
MCNSLLENRTELLMHHNKMALHEKYLRKIRAAVQTIQRDHCPLAQHKVFDYVTKYVI